MKKLLVLLSIIGLAFTLVACGSKKPEEEMLKDKIYSSIGMDADIKAFKVESFEAEKMSGTAICEVTYEKDNASIEKVFTIRCTKQEDQWGAEKITNTQLKKAVPLAGVSEEAIVAKISGGSVEITEHHTDLEGLKDEMTITQVQEEEGVKITIQIKRKYEFKNESWSEVSTEEISTTIEPTKGVEEAKILEGSSLAEIIDRQTDLDNKKDDAVLEQREKNSFFEKIITTTKSYEFKDNKGWVEVQSEKTERIEDIGLVGTWKGRDTDNSSDVIVKITELGADGQIKGEIQCAVGTFDFESKLEREDKVFFKTEHSGYDFKIQTGEDTTKLKIWAWNYGGIYDTKIDFDGLEKAE